MVKHHFELREETKSCEVPEPHAIFRFLSHNNSETIADTYIEDPAILDFLVVVKKAEEGHRYIVRYSDSIGVPSDLRGRYFIAHWIYWDSSSPYPLLQSPMVLNTTSWSLADILSCCKELINIRLGAHNGKNEPRLLAISVFCRPMYS